ncbi:hypothetical protein [Streptomyces sp. NBC_01589]|uniref:hypothetical protein n=1 Tax=unclassified Streptomyces TaxID=2593676 RepID=UPI003863CCE5
MGDAAASRLGLGDRIRFDDRAWTVTALPMGQVQVADTLGQSHILSATEIVRMPGFEVLQRGPRSRPAPAGPARNSDASYAHARWWEHHLVEVITGLPPDAEPDTSPGPCTTPRSTI